MLHPHHPIPGRVAIRPHRPRLAMRSICRCCPCWFIILLSSPPSLLPPYQGPGCIQSSLACAETITNPSSRGHASTIYGRSSQCLRAAKYMVWEQHEVSNAEWPSRRNTCRIRRKKIMARYYTERWFYYCYFFTFYLNVPLSLFLPFSLSFVLPSKSCPSLAITGLPGGYSPWLAECRSVMSVFEKRKRFHEEARGTLEVRKLSS